MEHRNALIIDAELTQLNGKAERDTALEMLRRLPMRKRRRTSRAIRHMTPKGSSRIRAT